MDHTLPFRSMAQHEAPMIDDVDLDACPFRKLRFSHIDGCNPQSIGRAMISRSARPDACRAVELRLDLFHRPDQRRQEIGIDHRSGVRTASCQAGCVSLRARWSLEFTVASGKLRWRQYVSVLRCGRRCFRTCAGLSMKFLPLMRGLRRMDVAGRLC
jgi:hypothetical protein